MSGEASMRVILIQAREELKIAQDVRHALFLGFFSIEQVVSDFLQEIKRNAGISDGTVKQYNIGMSYKLNVELPLVLKPGHPARQLIPDLDAANKLRNGVVHKGRNVTSRQAGFVIQTADKLIKALTGE
jgi:hypothetical protein